MNAQVGKEEMYCPTIRKQSLHENTNEDGYRLIQFAILNNMVTGSTIFNIRIYINLHGQHQIDHLRAKLTIWS